MEAYMFQQGPSFGMTDTGKYWTAPTKPRKPKATTLREADWVPHNERIIQLHITENMPLKDVRVIMQEQHGFSAECVRSLNRIMG